MPRKTPDFGTSLAKIQYYLNVYPQVPPYLRRMGQWMAVITFSNYPPVEAQLANLTTGHAFGWGIIPFF